MLGDELCSKVDMNQCKLVVSIKKWVDINKYKYVYILRCIDNAGPLQGHCIVATP